MVLHVNIYDMLVQHEGKWKGDRAIVSEMDTVRILAHLLIK